MKLNSFAVLFLLAVVVIAGCTAPPSGNGGGNGAGETATGTLVLSITDQPSYAENYTAINVTISGIEVHKDGNWLSFFEGEKTVNLLELSGVKEVIGQDELEAGKYTQIRLAVSEAELVKADGSSEDVKVPSEEIKLVKSFDIADGELLELVLDFSPYSVVVAGNQYILKPVIKVLSTEEFQEKVEREANERGERERREKEVKIEQLVFPDTVEAGEEFEERKEIPKAPPKRSGPFMSVFAGFAELFTSFRARKEGRTSKKKPGQTAMMREAIAKSNAEASVKKLMWNVYHHFKKQHGMLNW